MNRYKQREDSSPLPGAAYIRFSSEMQSDSFSLDAQLRQIKEQAERDGVEIVKVFADPAQSAYRKKYRPGINAMREAARRGEFKVLYVHKVDRLARRLEWSLEIVHELQELPGITCQPACGSQTRAEGYQGSPAAKPGSLRALWPTTSCPDTEELPHLQLSASDAFSRISSKSPSVRQDFAFQNELRWATVHGLLESVRKRKVGKDLADEDGIYTGNRSVTTGDPFADQRGFTKAGRC